MNDVETDVVTNEIPAAPAAEVAQDAPAPVTEAPIDGETQPEGDELPIEAPAPEGRVEWPSSAVNAMSRRDKNLAKSRRDNEDLRSQLAALKDQDSNADKGQSDEPKEEDFDNWTQWQRALNQWDSRNIHNEGNQGNAQELEQLSPEDQQRQEWVTTRADAVAETHQELGKSITDYAETMAAYNDIFSNIPADLELFVLGLDDTAHTLYLAAKAGKIESMVEAWPFSPDAVKAQLQAFSGQKPAGKVKTDIQDVPAEKDVPKDKTSDAPKPIGAVKGSGTVTKDLDDLSPRELKRRILPT